jgi:hypothetical protein
MVLTWVTDACDDGQFGPIVATGDCRGGFDFTVLFESEILSIVPAACFLLLASFRVLHLFRQSQKVLSSTLRVVTLVSNPASHLPPSYCQREVSIWTDRAF